MSNYLVNLTKEFPKGLLYLNCADNLLEIIPFLPDGLEYLDYGYNHLLVSPNIPTSVKIIHNKNGLAVEKEFTII